MHMSLHASPCENARVCVVINTSWVCLLSQSHALPTERHSREVGRVDRVNICAGAEHPLQKHPLHVGGH